MQRLAGEVHHAQSRSDVCEANVIGKVGSGKIVAVKGSL